MVVGQVVRVVVGAVVVAVAVVIVGLLVVAVVVVVGSLVVAVKPAVVVVLLFGFVLIVELVLLPRLFSGPFLQVILMAFDYFDPYATYAILPKDGRLKRASDGGRLRTFTY